MTIQRIRSKLAKTRVLLRDQEIRTYIPATARMTRDSLAAMLNAHGMVYVKPDTGTFGNGVIRVEKNGDACRLQHGTRVRTFSGFDALYAGILQTKRPGTYVVQRGIHLLKHRKRRFDLRVMVQRNPAGQWETTGIIGRLAHPRKIVTNYHSGGTVTPFSQLLSGHMSPSEQEACRSRLRRLGTAVGRQLQTRYPRMKELGLDVALDDTLRPWILEVNTSPDPFIFRKLADRSVFRRIYRYAVLYGKYPGRRSRSRIRRRPVRTRRRG